MPKCKNEGCSNVARMNIPLCWDCSLKRHWIDTIYDPLERDSIAYKFVNAILDTRTAPQMATAIVVLTQKVSQQAVMMEQAAERMKAMQEELEELRKLQPGETNYLGYGSEDD